MLHLLAFIFILKYIEEKFLSISTAIKQINNIGKIFLFKGSKL